MVSITAKLLTKSDSTLADSQKHLPGSNFIYAKQSLNLLED